MKFLIELAPDLDLGSEEVEFLWLLQVDILIIAVNLANDLLDQTWLGLRNHVVEHDWQTVLVDVLNCIEHVTLNELGRSLKVLQVVLNGGH